MGFKDGLIAAGQTVKKGIAGIYTGVRDFDCQERELTKKERMGRRVIISAFFCVFLFLTCLEGLTGVAIIDKLLKHIDELMVMVFTAYALVHIPYLWSEKRLLMCLWLAFMGMGFLSSLVFRYQSLVPTMIDAVVIVNKFMMSYVAVYCYVKRSGKVSAFDMLTAARIVTVILFVLGVWDLFFDTPFPVGEYRYFANSLLLVFPHQTYLAAACATLLIYLGYTHQRRSSNLVYMIMISLVGFMTLRSKSMAFFVVYWGLYLGMVVLRIRNLPILVGGAGVVCLLLGYKQIIYYFIDPPLYSPRQIMLKDSIKLATEHFPLGTGFGSFGSGMAEDYYSVLYQSLGYENNWGMTSSDGMFLSDCFWPEIIAQFGYLGMVLFILVVAVLMKYSLDRFKQDRNAGFAMLMTMALMLINSIAESSFFNPTSLLLFVLFAVMEVCGSESGRRPGKYLRKKDSPEAAENS